jgi:hypothetical protein
MRRDRSKVPFEMAGADQIRMPLDQTERHVRADPRARADEVVLSTRRCRLDDGAAKRYGEMSHPPVQPAEEFGDPVRLDHVVHALQTVRAQVRRVLSRDVGGDVVEK